MRQEFYDAVVSNPIIVAVKDEAGLEKCLKLSEISVVFILFGEISNISKIVQKVKNSGKTAVVHMDLIAGLSSKVEAVDFIAEYTEADGIISTHIEQIKRAKDLSLSTVYRIFLIDSKVLDKLNGRIREVADIVEILPGLMPKMIKMISKKLNMPIIAGGLISDKEDVLAALDAGAIAISSTNEKVWNM
ncbi:MAG: glycerol-3-phosphate responsive antiterminator [Lachnospiraceae bacterium]|nr:glycerol-3-phosphate responsive antiterminator [Lachnospiraceae bacterium]